MRLQNSWLLATTLLIFAAGCGPEWIDDPTGRGEPLGISPLPTKPRTTVSLLATGAGWRRLSVTGTLVDMETKTSSHVSGEEVYVVTGSGGIAAVPLPQMIRDDLSADLTARLAAGELDNAQGAVYFVHKDTALALANGTLAKGTKGTKTAPKSACSDYTKDYDKTLSFDRPVSHTGTFSSGFNGKLLLSGNVKGMATGTVRLKIHKALCVPYWASLVHVKVNGNMEARGRLTAQGSFSGEWHWDKQIAKFHLGELAFSIGPIPITVGFNMPVDLGIDASAKLTANLDGNVKASGSFDVTCTTSECTGQKNYNYSFDAVTAPTVSINGRAQVEPWIQGALRAYVYDDGIVHGQVGVRPSIIADLWGYSGNTCGDADNDGQNEWVTALTLDVDVGVDVTARLFVDIPGLPNVDKDWSWNVNRWHVAFWNLSPDADVLAPMFYRKKPGPNEVYDPSLCSGLVFRGRMRPCWPYADEMDYHIDWNDGVASDFTLPPNALFVACKSYGFPGPASAELTAIKDAHGRTLNRTTAAATGYSGQPSFPDDPQEIAP